MSIFFLCWFLKKCWKPVPSYIQFTFCVYNGHSQPSRNFYLDMIKLNLYAFLCLSIYLMTVYNVHIHNADISYGAI